jgi:hypothetical protein
MHPRKLSAGAPNSPNDVAKMHFRAELGRIGIPTSRWAMPAVVNAILRQDPIL